MWEGQTDTERPDPEPRDGSWSPKARTGPRLPGRPREGEGWVGDRASRLASGTPQRQTEVASGKAPGGRGECQKPARRVELHRSHSVLPSAPSGGNRGPLKGQA